MSNKEMAGDAIVLSKKKAIEEILENMRKQDYPEHAINQMREDLENNQTTRKLTKTERELYASALVTAVSQMSAFRDAVNILNPYMDALAPTAYVDQYARVAVSPWFLHKIGAYERGAVLLHESMHVLNNQFERREREGISMKYFNLAGDMEINTTLKKATGVPLPEGCIFPDEKPYQFNSGLTMEKYASLLKDSDADEKKFENQPNPNEQQQQDQSGSPQSGGSSSQDQEESEGESDGNSQGQQDSGNGEEDKNSKGKGSGKSEKDSNSKEWGCGEVTEEKVQNADDIGIERASEAEQNSVIKNTAAKVAEEAAKARQAGRSHMDEFYNLVLERMYRPKVNWRDVFRSAVGKANSSAARGRAHYSYRRTNRRLNSGKFIFPGMVTYKPTMMLGLDISGSMTSQDYEIFMTELESIMKNCARSNDSLKIFPVDTTVGNTQVVKSVKDLKLRGGGGTMMEVGLMYVKSLPKKTAPDIFVLTTDGGTDWKAFEREAIDLIKYCKVIVLVTSKYGWGTVPDSLKNLLTVIDVTEDK